MGGSSGRVVLVCEECGERLVLGGPDEARLATRTRFECGCGRHVSPASCPKEAERAEPRGPETGPAPEGLGKD